MAEWILFTGDPRGCRCEACQRFLSPPDVIYVWRTRKYHDGCLLDVLTAVAPPDPIYYSPPGSNWVP